MSRLTKRLGDQVILNEVGITDCGKICDRRKDFDNPCDECPIDDTFRKLAHYEDLEEQGRLIELPCKVGDTVWTVGKNYNKCENHYDCEDYDSEEYLITWCEAYCPNGYRGTGVIQGRVYMMEVYEDKIYVGIDVGRRCLREPVTNIFLTKEEAQKRLEEFKNEQERRI